jgi:hypothetical protein
MHRLNVLAMLLAMLLHLSHLSILLRLGHLLVRRQRGQAHVHAPQVLEEPHDHLRALGHLFELRLTGLRALMLLVLLVVGVTTGKRVQSSAVLVKLIGYSVRQSA